VFVIYITKTIAEQTKNVVRIWLQAAGEVRSGFECAAVFHIGTGIASCNAGFPFLNAQLSAGIDLIFTLKGRKSSSSCWEVLHGFIA
jgi:hypothetical protein